MKPGSFKSMVNSLAKHMVNILKKGGPEAAKATKKQKRPTYEAPEEVLNGTKRDELIFDFKYGLYLKKQANWEETLGRIFEKVSSHYLTNMKQKL